MSEEKQSGNLVWFRNDLRVEDNTALAAAARDGAPLAAVFLVCAGQWEAHDVAPVRTDFLFRNLAELRKTLDRQSIPLLVLDCGDFGKVPAALAKLCGDLGVGDVYCNLEYGFNERVRDAKTRDALEKAGLRLHTCTDQVLYAPGTLLNGSGEYYKVFTAFRKKWLEGFGSDLVAERTARKLKPLDVGGPVRGALDPDQVEKLRARHGSDAVADLYPAGEKEARGRLRAFISDRVADYEENRDFPGREGTSGLSPWLAAGVISVRACLRAALEANRGRADGGKKGISCWISELTWREFYRHVLVGFPQVNCNMPFRAETDNISWRSDDQQFRAWCEGSTGYPLVDAGMRQLNETGWMHNRLRMVTAMFLAKHLLIDWRRGEQYFMQKLVDGDFASNNGGWQWSASTGTDAVPYFRIFNPFTQSERFDPEGDFIRRYVPELADLDAREIHAPHKHRKKYPDLDYPEPIVDHKEARQRALAAFKNA